MNSKKRTIFIILYLMSSKEEIAPIKSIASTQPTWKLYTNALTTKIYKTIPTSWLKRLNLIYDVVQVYDIRSLDIMI